MPRHRYRSTTRARANLPLLPKAGFKTTGPTSTIRRWRRQSSAIWDRYSRRRWPRKWAGRDARKPGRSRGRRRRQSKSCHRRGPKNRSRQRQSFAMAEAIARGNLEQVRALIGANPAVVNTPLRIDTGEEELNPAGTTKRRRFILRRPMANGRSSNSCWSLAPGSTPPVKRGGPPCSWQRGHATLGVPRAEQVVQLLERHGAALDLNSAIYLRRVDWVKQHLRTHKRRRAGGPVSRPPDRGHHPHDRGPPHGRGRR